MNIIGPNSIIAVFDVEESATAKEVGSGGLSVLATPVLVSWIEARAFNYIEDNYVKDGETNVGSYFEINHIAPSPVGAEITILMELVENKGNKFNFSFKVLDQNEKKVAYGTHKRVIVNTEKFLKQFNE